MTLTLVPSFYTLMMYCGNCGLLTIAAFLVALVRLAVSDLRCREAEIMAHSHHWYLRCPLSSHVWLPALPDNVNP